MKPQRECSSISARTRQEDVVKKVLGAKPDAILELDQLSRYQERVFLGQIVFIVFTGNQDWWDFGLAAIAKIVELPVPDDNFSDKKGDYYKVKVGSIISFKEIVKKEDFVEYPDLFGLPFVGPRLKGEQSQSPAFYTEKQTLDLLGALIMKGAISLEDIKTYFTEWKDKIIAHLPSLTRALPVENKDYERLKAFRESLIQNSKTSSGLKYKTGIKVPYKHNRIFFGAPGTGKSYLLNEQCEDCVEQFDAVYERVTFYPDYYYSNFFGTYKPLTDENGEITYSYVPGPFLRMLIKSLKNALTDHPVPHILIIEEINRAKAASVFGEVFQLLDRNLDGVSEYSVSLSEDAQKYVADQLKLQKSEVKEIKLPDNLFIWASMNSADQGVYPVDSAFKRRWSFEYQKLDNDRVLPQGEIVLRLNGEDKKINWDKLRKAINGVLSRDCFINEDKLMGTYFLNVGELRNKESFTEAFKNKVLMYLFEDAARACREHVFRDPGLNQLSLIQEDFNENGLNVFSDLILSSYES